MQGDANLLTGLLTGADSDRYVIAGVVFAPTGLPLHDLERGKKGDQEVRVCTRWLSWYKEEGRRASRTRRGGGEGGVGWRRNPHCVRVSWIGRHDVWR
jgi:hypothetical protein